MISFHERLKKESLKKIIQDNDIMNYASRAYLDDKFYFPDYNSDSLNIEFIASYVSSYLGFTQSLQDELVENLIESYCPTFFYLRGLYLLSFNLNKNLINKLTDVRFSRSRFEENEISLVDYLRPKESYFETQKFSDLDISKCSFVKCEHPYIRRNYSFLDNNGNVPDYSSLEKNGDILHYDNGTQPEDVYNDVFLYDKDKNLLAICLDPEGSLINAVISAITKVYAKENNVDAFIAHYEKTVEIINLISEYISNDKYRRLINNIIFLCGKGLLLDSAVVLQKLADIYISSLDELLDSESRRGQKLDCADSIIPGLYISMSSSDYASLYESILFSKEGVKKSLMEWKDSNRCFSTTRKNFPDSNSGKQVRRVHIRLTEFVKLFFTNDLLRDKFILKGIDTYNKKFKDSKDFIPYEYGRDYYSYYLSNKEYIDENFDLIKCITALNVRKFGSLYVVTCDGGLKYCVSSSLLKNKYIEYGTKFVRSYVGDSKTWDLTLSDFNSNKVEYHSNFNFDYFDYEGNLHSGSLQFIRPLEYNAKRNSKQLFICHKNGLMPEHHDHSSFIKKVSEIKTESIKLLAEESKNLILEQNILSSKSLDQCPGIYATSDQGINNAQTLSEEMEYLSDYYPKMSDIYLKQHNKNINELKAENEKRLEECINRRKSIDSEYQKKRKLLTKLVIAYTSLSPMGAYDVSKLIEIGLITYRDLKKSKRLIGTRSLFSLNNFVMTERAYYFACTKLMGIVEDNLDKYIPSPSECDDVLYNRYHDITDEESYNNVVNYGDLEVQYFNQPFYDEYNHKIVSYDDLLALSERKRLIKELSNNNNRPLTEGDFASINAKISSLTVDDLIRINNEKGVDDLDFAQDLNCNGYYLSSMDSLCSRVCPKDHASQCYFNQDFNITIDADSYEEFLETRNVSFNGDHESLVVHNVTSFSKHCYGRLSYIYEDLDEFDEYELCIAS